MNELLVGFASSLAILGIMLHIVQAFVKQSEHGVSVSSRDVFAHVAGAAALSFASQSLSEVLPFAFAFQWASLALWIHLYYRASGGNFGSLLTMSIATLVLYFGVGFAVLWVALLFGSSQTANGQLPYASVGVCLVVGLLGVGLFLRHVRQEKMYREFAEEAI